MIQIWTALIAILILKVSGISFYLWLGTVESGSDAEIQSLYYRDLWQWTDSPCESLLIVPDAEQLSLSGI
jgi:hypothetical protein